MSLNELATFGGGVVALGLILRVFWQRARTERSIDDRVIRQLGERDATIKALHQRNQDLNDRMHTMMRESIDLARTHGAQIMQAVNQVRQEHHDSLVRVHAKLEAAEARLAECTSHHGECLRRLEAIEARMPVGS